MSAVRYEMEGDPKIPLSRVFGILVAFAVCVAVAYLILADRETRSAHERTERRVAALDERIVEGEKATRETQTRMAGLEAVQLDFEARVQRRLGRQLLSFQLARRCGTVLTVVGAIEIGSEGNCWVMVEEFGAGIEIHRPGVPVYRGLSGAAGKRVRITGVLHCSSSAAEQGSAPSRFNHVYFDPREVQITEAPEGAQQPGEPGQRDLRHHADGPPISAFGRPETDPSRGMSSSKRSQQPG
jgi:hypothetical protein